MADREQLRFARVNRGPMEPAAVSKDLVLHKKKRLLTELAMAEEHLDQAFVEARSLRQEEASSSVDRILIDLRRLTYALRGRK